MNEVRVIDYAGSKIGLAYIQDETDAVLVIGYDQAFLATEILAHRNTFNWYEPDQCLQKLRNSNLPEQSQTTGTTILGMAAVLIYQGLQSEQKLKTAQSVLRKSKPLLEDNPMSYIYFFSSSVVYIEISPTCRFEVLYSKVQVSALMGEITEKLPFETGNFIHSTLLDSIEPLPEESELVPDGNEGLIAECVVIAMMDESTLPARQEIDLNQAYPWRDNHQNN